MDQEKTYKWIQDRLRDLNSGTITEQDMLRLKEIAKEDAFVADALEGYHLHPDISHSLHLDALAHKINIKKRERRRWLIPNLTVTAIAASLLLIVGTWAVISRMEKKDDTLFVFVAPDSLIISDSAKENIALGDDQQAAPTTETTTLPESTSSKSVQKKTSKNIQAPIHPSAEKERKKSIPESELKATADETGLATSDEPIKPAEIATTTQPPSPPPAGLESKPITIERVESSFPKDALAKRDEGYYANQMDPGMMARRVTGRILDAGGQPLIGANLSVHNTNLTATTDLNGRFELYLPLPESEINISFSGYNDSNVIMHQGEEDLAYTLSENIALSEVALLDAARSKEDHAASGGPASTKAKQNDKTQFADYLKKNSRFPLRDNFYLPGKDVTVEFTITAEGKPTNIKINSSSGDQAYDAEAMRLIRKGPEWKCDGEVYPCVRAYTIYFK